MVGSNIAHYTILEKLGEGGMGVVYKALDTHLDRMVALKVLPPGKVADPERRRRFVQEAKAASALHHPNIVTVHDIDQRDGIDYIVMEYVPGKPLNDLIPRRGMRLNQALKVAIQIADALAAAHEAGIVHRDLKPANVMVSEKGQVKVLDFGLAKLSEVPSSQERDETVTTPLTGEHTIVGSVNYMSPEQAQGIKVDARSDIFSFGAVLYEMATGRRAFQGGPKMSVLAAIIHREPEPVGAGLPYDLGKIISRCLRKHPARRFQTMSDLKVALEELNEESESGRLQAVHPVPRTLRRKSWVWPAALILLLGIAALAYLSLRPSPAPVQQLKAVPLTTYPGYECCASFSPDGTQVAFTWNGEKQDNFDIYIQVIGTGRPLRRTTDPAPDQYPAWSPDGRFIAFSRRHGEKVQIVRMPALSGPEEVLAELSNAAGIFSTPAWTPDSRWLAYSEGGPPQGALSVFMLSTESGERRKLTNPPPSSMGDFAPAFHPTAISWRSSAARRPI